MKLNPNVWMPHLKFTLQTMAITYPSNPNDVAKKKYYDFISNLPVFIPIDPIGKNSCLHLKLIFGVSSCQYPNAPIPQSSQTYNFNFCSPHTFQSFTYLINNLLSL